MTILMRAYWSESRDISDPNVLAEIAASANLDARKIGDVISDERYKTALDEATRDAVAGGVFGVPSFMIGGKLFFGNDRLELLQEYLTVARPA